MRCCSDSSDPIAGFGLCAIFKLSGLCFCWIIIYYVLWVEKNWQNWVFDGQWPLVTCVNDIGIYSYTVVLITVILFFCQGMLINILYRKESHY